MQVLRLVGGVEQGLGTGVEVTYSDLAIVIAVGFVVATLVLSQTSRATVLEAAGAEYVDAAVVVTSDSGAGLADGRLAGEVQQPTSDSIIDALRGLGA